MISVVIPTRNAEADLAIALSALVPAVVDGLVREVIIADGGSTDRTLQIAENAGVDVVHASAGRGSQLQAGVKRARFPWLLILHADTELSPGWQSAASQFIERVTSGRLPEMAAAFQFQLADEGLAPRMLEAAVGMRSGLLKLPYGDQGLLISRALYDRVGGYKAIPLMEDVDLVRRLGRRRITLLRAQASTSPRRFRESGYARRIVRNQVCLALYWAGINPHRIARLYEAAPAATISARAAPDNGLRRET